MPCIWTTGGPRRWPFGKGDWEVGGEWEGVRGEGVMGARGGLEKALFAMYLWCKRKWTIFNAPSNSIAFGSAPRREADRQPISQLARPAVSQVRQKHTVWVFCQWQTGVQAVERTNVLREW